MFAIIGGDILTITRGTIKDGTILVENGKIKSIGEDLPIPSGVKVINGKGKIIMPGLIDAHTHQGLYEQGLGFEGKDHNDSTDPLTPHLRAIDGFNHEDEGIREALTSGVTTVITMPGSANVVGGQAAAIKTYGKSVDDMIIREPIGLKVAFGENPKRVYGSKNKMPSTRMGTAALLREAMINVQNYINKMEKGMKDPDKLPDRDLKMEPIVKVLNREMPLFAHAHRADDILTAIRIAKEFNIDIIIHHGTEGHKVVDFLAENHIPVATGPTFGVGRKVENHELSFKTPVILNNAGVKVAIMSDHPIRPCKYLLIYAAMAIKEGMPPEDALKAVTINPAEIGGVSDRVGSLEVGKDADILILSGSPFDIMTKVQMVMVNGDIIINEV